MASSFLLEDICRDQIMTRLPIKSLIRCRCVCKSWNFLFFDPKFARSHFVLNIPKNPSEDDYLILIKTFLGPSSCVISLISRNNLFETRINKIPYLLSSKVDEIYLIGSINGLVCFGYLKGVNYYFILWNPVTHYLSKIILLPRWGRFIYQNPIEYLFGFGWDSVKNDYKLVATPSSCSRMPPAVVYSCKTESWSTSVDISKVTPLYIGKCRAPCVVVKGIPYWNFPRNSHKIIKFDVRTDEFSRMSSFPNVYQSFISLVNINDCVGLIEYGRCSSYVYRYSEEGNYWSKVHTVYSWNNVIEPRLMGSKYGGEIVYHRENILYDPKSNQMKMIDYNNRGYSAHGFSYTPSLLAPEEM